MGKKDFRKRLSLSKLIMIKKTVLNWRGERATEATGEAKTSDMEPWVSARMFTCQLAKRIWHVMQSEDYFS